MKERCKNCSVYETKKCKCWSCEDDCKNGITSLNGTTPYRKDENMLKTKKNIFKKLENEITNFNDLDIYYLVELANKELRQRHMRAGINNKKTIDKKQKENEQG